MNIAITLTGLDDTIEITSAGTAGLHRMTVRLGSDQRFKVVTENEVDVPTLGTLAAGALTYDAPTEQPLELSIGFLPGDPEAKG